MDPAYGLADQLLEFDPSEYGQLKQEFSTSSLSNGSLRLENSNSRVGSTTCLTVSNSSDDDDELDEFYDCQSRPSLLLHDPSYGYWISALRLELVTFAFVDWNLFSASLPSSFLWLLQLICEGIEESPRDFYPTLNAVEAIVFLGHTDVKRNITGNQQLYNALRAEF
ncbi:hypothetical protein DAPPUDRAFT_245298 [Daphnia pulex]|uniref:Uncharacterized protein n=1 Tax=Daphnia pulex TaxID=6669 RepID=E9GN11_DAPPU|nr:hypothetical protein DAPPUDRAFT_245298 [Daphnia pulex]|eukprot:EFX79193.1 hypothetical protein DAPPUDRAFT_245298 [Daphnia pulex]